MSKGVIFILCVLTLFFGVMAVGISTYTSAHDDDAQYMADIKRLNEGSKSELSNYTLKIKEMVQIPSMYTNDLQKVISTYFESKGDRSNQQSVIAFMQDKVPNMDSSMYNKIMVTIDSGRDAFNNIQKRKIDICAEHQAFRTKFWNKQILGMFIPSDDYQKMCRTVSDRRTNEAFESGVQEELQLK